MRTHDLYVVDRETFKITVEEHDGGSRFLATCWDKTSEEEADRYVTECETAGHAYRAALSMLDEATGGVE